MLLIFEVYNEFSATEANLGPAESFWSTIALIKELRRFQRIFLPDFIGQSSSFMNQFSVSDRLKNRDLLKAAEDFWPFLTEMS